MATIRGLIEAGSHPVYAQPKFKLADFPPEFPDGCTSWTHWDGSWGGSVCGSALKSDEARKVGTCNRHLAGKRRRAATDARYEAEAEAASAAYDVGNAKAERLSTATGLTFTYVAGHAEGHYRVSAADAEAFLGGL